MFPRRFSEVAQLLGIGSEIVALLVSCDYPDIGTLELSISANEPQGLGRAEGQTSGPNPIS